MSEENRTVQSEGTPSPSPSPAGSDRGPRPYRSDRGGDRGDRPERGDRRRGRRPRRKACQFCVDKVKHIDYKETGSLRRYVSERGKILPRRMTGNCAKHQRQLSVAIKRARFVALLPYSTE